MTDDQVDELIERMAERMEDALPEELPSRRTTYRWGVDFGWAGGISMTVVEEVNGHG